MSKFLIIGLGGAIGSILRAAIIIALSSENRKVAFPYETIIVNVTGCIVMGMVCAVFSKIDTSEMRLFLTLGVLGGFTTFSAFSTDVAGMIGGNQIEAALLYTLSSVLLSVSGFFVGFAAVKLFF